MRKVICPYCTIEASLIVIAFNFNINYNDYDKGEL